MTTDQRAIIVVSAENHREGMQISVVQTEVELTVASRYLEHCDEIVAAPEEHIERVR